MLTAQQVEEYFIDLQDDMMRSAIALVHSRFSTNTFPTWDLAQPFRMIAHNGEINTLKGNRFWFQARESLLKSDLLGDDIKKIYPVIEPEKSDSASFDNAFEFLFMAGKSLPHSLAMLIPESWNEKNPIPDDLKAFYEYHSTIMEPWDGPASIIFSDGRYIGGVLDRNGLRPSRYVITKDDVMVMGSEVGVQTFDASEIVEKGRLRPGKILMIDTGQGTVKYDPELKNELAGAHPYRKWLEDNRITLEELDRGKASSSVLGNDYARYVSSFNYTREEVVDIIAPMAQQGQEPTGSMGNDTPIAILSEKPQRLFSYFRQLFAQVTNPAIDPIREELVMTNTGYLGSLQKNLLAEIPDHVKMIKFISPILTNTQIDILKNLKYKGFNTVTINMHFKASDGEKGLQESLERICEEAGKAVDDGCQYIILSDKNISKDHVPIPSLLGTAAVHHYLIEQRKRLQTGLVIETGDAREVMHFALLFGFGASVINPYLAFSVIDKLVKEKHIHADYSKAEANYVKAVNKGIKKVLSKMGISTLRSYRAAQIFECIGLNQSVVDKYFKGTVSRIGGIGLKEIAEEVLIPHKKAFEGEQDTTFGNTGFYQIRHKGEHHGWNPETVALLQWASKTNNYEKYKEFSNKVQVDNAAPGFLRGFLTIKKNPIDIDKVEPVENIMKRFVTGAMSYGSISREAHEALAIAMNTIGGRSNTGEGGEDPVRFKTAPDGLNRRSAIKQVASGRFGVTNNYLVNADEIQIKIAQGAKPGEGGQLPGHKVDEIIAKTRYSIPGITLISPPPHHDIYSIEDLKQLIFDLKNANPHANISVKLVSEAGVGTVAAGVSKAIADLITIDRKSVV
jgi:glutamate synthase (NADPH) large chain